MADKNELGAAVPRGVVDTKTGKVGVPEQPIEEQVQWLREQVDSLKDMLSDLEIPSGRAVATRVMDTGRRTGEMAREHPAWTALALMAVAGLLIASTSRSYSYWPMRRSSRLEDIIADLEDRLSDLKGRYWSSGWRSW
ncbi:hypothetical protein PYH37_004767 [Sinorhizobium numidicum]|uniref:DUF3618 domain-containing protein n=1 Tax=Sinorhizobium numidicum TaxID=680248 RepID=A0ABY8CWU7_9HYPH|nr:hypothetical protein [Sinorhizobium numidicum]WEX76460.1 hypothetical protein PYH37_004767 [Sinorhizobium numidicum]WEX83121.1 hypothetical protein PYH38_005479 [Sinorhizobium numidicum]